MAKSQDNEHGLTDLELRFCHEYAIDLNGTKAVMRSGAKYASDGAAATRASELLRKPKIRLYLAELLQLTAASVTTEICRIAFANLTDLCEFNNDGIKVKSSDTLNDRAKSALKSIKVVEYYPENGGKVVTTEIRMHDKLAALEKLMRKLKIYPAQIDVMQAIKVLSTEGLLVPGQVEAIETGIADLRTKLEDVAHAATAST